MSVEPLAAGALDDRRGAKALASAIVDAGGRATVSQADALRVMVGDDLYEFSGGPREYILADPCIENFGALQASVKALVDTMERAEIRCRFEVYEGQNLISYHHANWPQGGEAR